MREVSARLPHRHVVDVDPEDPSQQLDDIGAIYVEPLAVDAQPVAEAAEDFDIASAENVGGDSEIDEEEWFARGDAYSRAVEGTGELYGIRTPHAGYTHLTAAEDRDSFEGSWRGETWLESLEEHAIAMGPAPEEEVVIIDDTDTDGGRSPTEGGDRPVADKGAGGRGGL